MTLHRGGGGYHVRLLGEVADREVTRGVAVCDGTDGTSGSDASDEDAQHNGGFGSSSGDIYEVTITGGGVLYVDLCAAVGGDRVSYAGFGAGCRRHHCGDGHKVDGRLASCVFNRAPMVNARGTSSQAGGQMVIGKVSRTPFSEPNAKSSRETMSPLGRSGGRSW
ncbi:hypothetical protein ACSQ67_025473 [Phaseolus vulgaris]